MVLSKDQIEPIVMGCLSVPKELRPKNDAERNHFEYLLGVYERAFNEERRVSGLKVRFLVLLQLF